MTTPPSDFSSPRCSACGTFHAAGAGCPAGSALHVGAVLDGKYELTRLVGSGGMGEVYEGRHRIIGRRVAVKFLHGEHARQPELATRFANEARAAGGIEHENIAGVYDVGAMPDGTQYLVMEFLDGADLEKLVRAEGVLPVPRVVFAIIQACRGLDVVHGQGIVHRDLKPSNLFVTRRADKTDLIKVIDFGIAKLNGLGGASATKTGTAMGTAFYMSPEQARGERDVGPATDIYALGIILYELLGGKKPYEGDSFLQVLHQVMLQQPVPLRALRPGLPDGLYDVVVRAMSPHAADRFPSVAALGDALLPYVGRVISAIQSSPAEQMRAAETQMAAESQLPPAMARTPSAGLGRGTMTPVNSVAVGTSAPPLPAPKSRVGWMVGSVVAAVGVVGMVGLGVRGLAGDRPGAAAASAGAIANADAAAPVPTTIVRPVETVTRVAPPPEEPAIPPPAPTVVSQRVSDVSTVSGHKTQVTAEKHADAAPAVVIAEPAVTAAPTTTVAPIVPISPAKPAPNCDPPFTLDESGHHHYKPECIK